MGILGFDMISKKNRFVSIVSECGEKPLAFAKAPRKRAMSKPIRRQVRSDQTILCRFSLRG